MATQTNGNQLVLTDTTNGTTATTTAHKISGSLSVAKTIVTDGTFGITSQTSTDILIYSASGQSIQLTGNTNLNSDTRLVSGLNSNVNIFVNDTTLGSSDYVVIANKGTAIAFQLPAASAKVGRTYRIKNIGAGTLTVNRAGSDTIDGGTSTALTTNQVIDLIATTSSTWNIF